MRMNEPQKAHDAERNVRLSHPDFVSEVRKAALSENVVQGDRPLELFLGKSLRHDAAATEIDELSSGLERNGLYLPHIGSSLPASCR